jgi:hypothetical protein
MNINELENKITNLESMLFRVVDFMAIGADKIDLYDFINNEAVRRQLELDFILMEKSPASNFNMYCQYSLFQIENLLNYYYDIRFRDKFDDAKQYFGNESKNNVEESTKKGIRVSELPYGTKFTKFAIEYLVDENKKPTKLNKNIQNIAYVRHTTIHRNTIDIEKYEQDILNKFEILSKDKSNKTKEDWKLFNLGVKVQFKHNSSFSLVKRVMIEFIDVIKPLIESHQKGG